eukprot:10778181-Karenia_brevis.AAC.1
MKKPLEQCTHALAHEKAIRIYHELVDKEPRDYFKQDDAETTRVVTQGVGSADGMPPPPPGLFVFGQKNTDAPQVE